MSMKKCSKCKNEKELSEFGDDNTKKCGKQSYCKTCQKKKREINKIIGYQSPTTTKEYQKEYHKDYYKNNKSSIFRHQKRYKDKNIETIKEYQNQYRKDRRLTDLDFKLSELIRTNVHRVFKEIGTSKETKTFDIVDYTPQQLKKHIEVQFTLDMSWDNHGILWELDHARPIKWFIDNKNLFENNNELCKAANSLNNLQPLLINDNRTKGSRC